ncbi:hypothetical protein [Phytohabitans kaempferiae]|uniref:Uncharacterized protein n=1 Tax=Phytohabitans kaempferiae TaxID=1620943 RepID=A0ABV6MBD8_9ACTN
MTDTSSPPRAVRLGGLLMWYAVLGGAVAWSTHLILAWGVTELACAGGHNDVAGVPLRTFVAGAVVLPGLATAAALAVAWPAWRRAVAATRAATDESDRTRAQRAAMMALIGLGADALFLAIIIAGGAALLVFPSCPA